MKQLMCFVVALAAFMVAHAPLACSEDISENKIVNQVSPLDQYDLSAVFDELAEAKNWFIGAVQADSKNAEALFEVYKKRENDIMDKLRENRESEWRMVQCIVSERKEAKANKPSYKPNPFQGFKTPSRNKTVVRIECRLDSMIWVPQGLGVISDIYNGGGGGGSSREYTNPPVQTGWGCYVDLTVHSPHWDSTSSGHCALALTLSQTYRHTEDYILRKIEEDMLVFNRMITEMSRKKIDE